jgi:hypothetical protein
MHQAVPRRQARRRNGCDRPRTRDAGANTNGNGNGQAAQTHVGTVAGQANASEATASGVA